MHELSVAGSIIELALSSVKPGSIITKINLKVGEHAGINAGSLVFAFDVLKIDAGLSAAELAIEEVKAAFRCRRCGLEQIMEIPPDKCSCGNDSFDLSRGRESFIESLEVED